MSNKNNATLYTADNNPSGLHFFAAANSKDGFVSYFDEILGDDIGKLHILIGGPGCGKSTVLKKIAAISEQKGYITEHIHCSSSPSSLDGVIIRDKKIAVIDGTPPHMYTPKIPGAREIYVDLGLAWNKDYLHEKRNEIQNLCRLKGSRYKRAYIYIAAANMIKNQSYDLVRDYILTEKLSKSVKRTYEKLNISTGKERKSPEIRLSRAVSGIGNLYFDSLCRMAKEKILIDDAYGTGFLYLEKLRKLALENGNRIVLSCDPEDSSRIDGIYFRECDTTISVFAKGAEKVINCSRFVDKTGVRSIKESYCFAKKAGADLMDEAYSALKDAAGFHDMTEEIYKSATDFSVTEKISENLCADIFGK